MPRVPGGLTGMCNVLIVEDDLIIALDEEMTLLDAGYTVVGTATTEEEAVALAARFHPDVMVVDIRLADGSRGPDAVARVRQTQSVHVIFASGNLDPATRTQLQSFHPVAMISKPFLPAQLAEAVALVA